MTKEVITTNHQVINYTSSEVAETLKRTVALGATDEEYYMFAELCKATGLNPFKKEVWFIKTKDYKKRDGTEVKGKVQIMTGINGFLAIANNHPQFDGMECEVKYNQDGSIHSATARVHRKDRRIPSTATALWSEYYKPNPYGNKGIWEQMGSIMISKCAKSLALREAFPQELNGLYTEDEMPAEFSSSATLAAQPAKEVHVEVVKEEPRTVQKAYAEPTPTAPSKPSSGSYTYEIPFKHRDFDMNEARATLKANKFRFDMATKVWTGRVEIPNLAQFLVKSESNPSTPPPAGGDEPPAFPESSIPDSWGDDDTIPF